MKRIDAVTWQKGEGVIQISPHLRVSASLWSDYNEDAAPIREKNEDKSKNPFKDDRGGHFWNGFTG
jgi:hypothetical protein